MQQTGISHSTFPRKTDTLHYIYSLDLLQFLLLLGNFKGSACCYNAALSLHNTLGPLLLLHLLLAWSATQSDSEY